MDITKSFDRYVIQRSDQPGWSSHGRDAHPVFQKNRIPS